MKKAIFATVILAVCGFAAAFIGRSLVTGIRYDAQPANSPAVTLQEPSLPVSSALPTASETEAGSLQLVPLLRAAVMDAARTGASPPGFANILLVGLPGQGNPAPSLSDSMLVVHLDIAYDRVFLFSMPRDLLIQVPGANYYAKLNRLYETGGVTLLAKKAEQITGLTIDRYAVVDLAAVREIVDALGGVNVYVDKDINDQTFPGDNSTFQPFQLKAGWRFLDGKTATEFIRTRHQVEGDFGRMKRQQELIAALREKVTGLSLVWDASTFLKILASVNAHVSTNLTSDEFLELYHFGKAVTNDHIVITPLDGDIDKHLFTTGDFMFGSERASIVKPLAGIEQYGDVQKYVKNVLESN